MVARRFTQRDLEELERAKILGVRSGDEHRYTAVWVVVVEGRVFARSWSDQPTGWYQAFLDEPRGSIQLGEREIPVLGRPPKSLHLVRAVTKAFAEKYPTPGSKKWVRGFAQPKRERTTLEFVRR